MLMERGANLAPFDERRPFCTGVLQRRVETVGEIACYLNLILTRFQFALVIGNLVISQQKLIDFRLANYAWRGKVLIFICCAAILEN